MRRPAERDGQATAEWLAVVGAVAVALAAGAVLADGLAGRVAARLAPPPAAVDLAAAVGGRRGALSPAGAAAWLAEDVGVDAARAAVDRAVVAELRARHAAWLAPSTVRGAPVRGRRTRAVIAPTGPIEVRVVPADVASGTGLDARAEAGAIALGWAGAGSLARRLARPLGIAVGAAQLALGLVDRAEARQPPGTRAGDIVVCRRAAIAIEAAARPGRTSRVRAWRVGVLRGGRLVLDAVVADDPCAPTG